MARGRHERWLEPDNLLLLEGWARDGLTEDQIAKNMGISRKTLYNWKESYLPILHAITRGKEVVDRQVENALLQSAIGHTEKIRKPIKVKIEKMTPRGKISEESIEYAEEEVYVPPDVRAQIFWLKNRKPDKWKERKDATDIEEQNVRIEKTKADIQKIKAAMGEEEELADDGFLEALKGTAVEDWKDEEE